MNKKKKIILISIILILGLTDSFVIYYFTDLGGVDLFGKYIAKQSIFSILETNLIGFNIIGFALALLIALIPYNNKPYKIRYFPTALTTTLLIHILFASLILLRISTGTNKSENSNHYLIKGISLRGNGHLDDAIVEFNKSIELDSKNYEAYIGRGYSFLMKKRFKDALQDFNDAIYYNSNSFTAYKAKGDAFFYQNLLDSAIVYYNLAIEILPDYADALGMKAIALLSLKKYKEAIISFDKGIESSGNNLKKSNLYLYRAVTETNVEDTNGFFKDINMAIELNPNNQHAFEIRGNYYHSIDMNDLAIRDWKRAGEVGKQKIQTLEDANHSH